MARGLLYSPDVCDTFVEALKKRVPGAPTEGDLSALKEAALSPADKTAIIKHVNEQTSSSFNADDPETFERVRTKAIAYALGQCVVCCTEPIDDVVDCYCTACLAIVSKMLALERFKPSVRERLLKFCDNQLAADTEEFKTYEAQLVADYVPKKCSYTGMACVAESLVPDALFSAAHYPDLASYGPNVFFVDENIKRLKGDLSPPEFVAVLERIMTALSSPEAAIKVWKKDFNKRILEIRREYLLEFGLCVCADRRHGVRPTFVLNARGGAHDDIYGCTVCGDTLALNLTPRFGADIDFMNDFVRNHKRCLCGTAAERLANGAYNINCVCSFSGKPFIIR